MLLLISHPDPLVTLALVLSIFFEKSLLPFTVIFFLLSCVFPSILPLDSCTLLILIFVSSSFKRRYSEAKNWEGAP